MLIRGNSPREKARQLSVFIGSDERPVIENHGVQLDGDGLRRPGYHKGLVRADSRPFAIDFEINNRYRNAHRRSPTVSQAVVTICRALTVHRRNEFVYIVMSRDDGRRTTAHSLHSSHTFKEAHLAKRRVKRAVARRAVKRRAVKRRVVKRRVAKKAVRRRVVRRRVAKKAVARRALKRRAVKRAVVKRAVRRAVIARLISEGGMNQ